MADFRRNTDFVDPQLREFTVLMGKEADLDLFGTDGDRRPLIVFMANDMVAKVSEQKGSFGSHRRRFTIHASLQGETTLEAHVGSKTGPNYVTPLKIRIPTPPTKDDFIRRLAEVGIAIARKYKLPPSIMIAQAMLESKNGSSDLALLDNSLYGITKRSQLSQGKEPDWYPEAKTIVLRLTVAKKGEDPVPDRFCAANSYAQAVEIWAQYVTRHPHTKQDQSKFKDPPWSDDDVKAVAELMPKLMFGVGEPKYPETLMKVVTENNLRRFD